MTFSVGAGGHTGCYHYAECQAAVRRPHETSPKAIPSPRGSDRSAALHAWATRVAQAHHRQRGTTTTACAAADGSQGKLHQGEFAVPAQQQLRRQHSSAAAAMTGHQPQPALGRVAHTAQTRLPTRILATHGWNIKGTWQRRRDGDLIRRERRRTRRVTLLPAPSRRHRAASIRPPRRSTARFAGRAPAAIQPAGLDAAIPSVGRTLRAGEPPERKGGTKMDNGSRYRAAAGPPQGSAPKGTCDARARRARPWRPGFAGCALAPAAGPRRRGGVKHT